MAIKDIKCVVAYLSGDQTRTWIQEVNVKYCSIPLEEAKLLFEIYNRINDEYNPEYNDTSYLGLDNLEEEVIVARNKRRSECLPNLDYSKIEYHDHIEEFMELINSDRYSSIKKYIGEDEDYFSLKDILDQHVVKQENYYWLDQTHVSQDEYMENYDCNHWYEICELYEGTELPFDISDEDVVSIFGFNKFVDFADLSYGC